MPLAVIPYKSFVNLGVEFLVQEPALSDLILKVGRNR